MEEDSDEEFNRIVKKKLISSEEETAKKEQMAKRVFMGIGSSYDNTHFYEEKKEDFEFEIVDQKDRFASKTKSKSPMGASGALAAFQKSTKPLTQNWDVELTNIKVPEEFDPYLRVRNQRSETNMKFKRSTLEERSNVFGEDSTKTQNQASKRAEHAILAGFRLASTQYLSVPSQGMRKLEDPFKGDEAKRIRYLVFCDEKEGKGAPPREFKGKDNLTNEDLERERIEFEHIYHREKEPKKEFVKDEELVKNEEMNSKEKIKVKEGNSEALNTQNKPKPRRKEPWTPSALLCARFGVRQPRFSNNGPMGSNAMVSGGFPENFRFK